MSPEPREDQQKVVPSGRQWRRIGIALVLLAVTFGFWFGGGLTALLHTRISNFLAERDYESAEDAIDWVHWLGCSTPETSFWEARLCRKLLRISDVVRLLKEAGNGGFDTERLRREAVLLQAQAGDIADVLVPLNQMVSDPRDDGAEICEAYVNGALISGTTDLALTILPVWKADFPNDPQSHYAEARFLEYQGHIEAAVKELQLSVELNRKHWPAQYALGRILLAQNSIDAALAQFNVASKMRDNAAPLFQVARCLRALGRSEEARAVLVDILGYPTSAIKASFARVGEPSRGLPIEFELGELESSLRNYEEAVRLLDLVLMDDPKNTNARYARAIALRGLKRTEEAERDFAEVSRVRTLMKEVDRLVDEINNKPDDAGLEKRCRVGELLLLCENGGRGEYWLREALHRDPGYVPAHKLLAEYYDKLSHNEPAYAARAEEHRKAAGLSSSKSEHENPGPASQSEQ